MKRTVLTWTQVDEIKRLYAEDMTMTQQRIADLFGVGRSTVNLIISGKRGNKAKRRNRGYREA